MQNKDHGKGSMQSTTVSATRTNGIAAESNDAFSQVQSLQLDIKHLETSINTLMDSK